MLAKHFAPGDKKVQKKLLLVQRSQSKVARPSTLVSFERALLVEYACQIWSLYLLWLKSYSEGYCWQQIYRCGGITAILIILPWWQWCPWENSQAAISPSKALSRSKLERLKTKQKDRMKTKIQVIFIVEFSECSLYADSWITLIMLRSLPHWCEMWCWQYVALSNYSKHISFNVIGHTSIRVSDTSRRSEWHSTLLCLMLHFKQYAFFTIPFTGKSWNHTILIAKGTLHIVYIIRKNKWN